MPNPQTPPAPEGGSDPILDQKDKGDKYVEPVLSCSDETAALTGAPDSGASDPATSHEPKGDKGIARG